MAIAEAVLFKASVLDSRMRMPDDISDLEFKIESWASVFTHAGGMWLLESIAAVDHHYQTSRYALMPKDVVDYVHRLPMDSSRERLQEWILGQGRHPFAQNVQTMAGMEFNQSGDPEQAKVEYQRWLVDNLDELTDRIYGRWTEGVAKIKGQAVRSSVLDPYGLADVLKVEA
ncbi:hypothetical protein SEA_WILLIAMBOONE_106 [Gordonia phage WilliamBoone]|nr:hypothetical protein SEA_WILLIAMBOONE_106 [Gordonia phage WilliamBoone]